MEHPIYPKLAMAGEFRLLPTKHDKTELSHFLCLGLIITADDPPDSHIVPFLDAVIHSALMEGSVPQTAVEVAKSLGKELITWPEYMVALAASGHDIDELTSQAKAYYESYLLGLTERKRKAEVFFELLQKEWAVSDEQVREHIDGSSIYDLIELVLVHSDAAKARLGAAKRHTENREMKNDVFAWLDANFGTCRSMDAAAETIVAKIAPVTFRTARDWVGAWKKLRSAGKP